MSSQVRHMGKEYRSKSLLRTRDFGTLNVLDLKPLKILFLFVILELLLIKLFKVIL